MRNSKPGRTLADGGLLPMDENLTPIISNYIRFNKLWLNYRALECVKVQFGASQGHCTLHWSCNELLYAPLELLQAQLKMQPTPMKILQVR